MPYTRSGKCVYKKKADGSQGKKKGCSDSEEKAKKYMSKLYSLDETDLDETDPMFLGGGAAEEEEGSMDEAVLRTWVRTILLNEVTNSKANTNVKQNWSALSRDLLAELKKHPHLKGLQVHLGSGNKSRRYIRFQVAGNLTDPQEEQLADHLYDWLNTTASRSPRATIPPGRGNRQAESGQFPTHILPDAFLGPADAKGKQAPIDIRLVFAGTLTKGKKSGGTQGYQYEIDLVSKVALSAHRDGPGGYAGRSATGETLPAQAKTGPNNSVSDLYIECNGNIVGVEAKLGNARSGQLNVQFDYSTMKFLCGKCKNPKKYPQQTLWVNAINSYGNFRRSMRAFRVAIDKTRPRGDRIGSSGILDSVNWQEWTDGKAAMAKARTGKKTKITGTELARFSITSTNLNDYYKSKQCSYVQVEGKGLFYLEGSPVLTNPVNGHTTAALNIGSPLKGNVRFSSNQDRYYMRTNFSNPLAQLPTSHFTLDDPDDMRYFLELLCDGKLPQNDPSSSPGAGGSGAALPEGVFQYAQSQVFLMETRQYAKSQLGLLQEHLIVEELSGADRSEIKRMIKKEIEGATNKREIEKAFSKKFEKELKKALGTSFLGTPGKINKFVVDQIYDEVNKWLADTATRNEIAEITKQVLVKLYRELSFSSPTIIKRIKV